MSEECNLLCNPRVFNAMVGVTSSGSIQIKRPKVEEMIQCTFSTSGVSEKQEAGFFFGGGCSQVLNLFHVVVFSVSESPEIGKISEFHVSWESIKFQMGL